MASRGELEQRIMELLWASTEPQSVAAVHAKLTAERELAYTTVMTVLDRLSKKGLVDRELEGRAWQYRPRASQAKVVADEFEAALSGLSQVERVEVLQRLLEGLDERDRRALGDAQRPQKP